MAFQISTPVFEGPLDLLLHLITRDEVDIYEVSLAGIVDGYLAEMEKLGPSGPTERGARVPLELGPATEFLVVAAVLVELKSRRLLPGHTDLELDEELAWVEERDRLLARLLECKTFRDAGLALSRLIGAASCSFPRTAGPDDGLRALQPDLLAGVTPADIHAAFLRAASPRPAPRVDVEHVAPIRVSVHEAIEELSATILAARSITFSQITEGVAARIEVIVRFLAVLELYKRGVVELEQASAFGELEITWVGDQQDVPLSGVRT